MPGHHFYAPTKVFLAIAAFAALPMVRARAQVQQPARDALVQGVTAFKAGHYDEAAKQFKRAVELDPNATVAKLYLGTAYAYEVVPNLDTPENRALADDAIQWLRQIPNTAPGYDSALREIASVYRNVGRFDEARDAELSVLKLAPEDAETHYTIGVIDWTQAYKFAVDALAAHGLQDDGVGNPRMSPETCKKIQAHNTTLADDAIAHLSRAVALNPAYSDAMAYLNLVYRRHADLVCADPSARSQDITLANEWARKSAAARTQACAPVVTPPIAQTTRDEWATRALEVARDAAQRDQHLDGWLFCDHHHRDPIASASSETKTPPVRV